MCYPMYHENNIGFDTSSIAHNFIPSNESISINSDSIALAYLEQKIIIIEGKLPSYEQVVNLGINTTKHRFIGRLNGKDYHIMQVESSEDSIGDELLIPLRQMFIEFTEAELKASMYGIQVLDWDTKTQFCGKCGSNTENSRVDLLKVCTNCEAEYYPRISPAVIVSVIKQDKILLALHSRWSERYTVLAGFVSPGETLEECVRREIMEEANIKVKNIKYFGSQPWPFPDSLMIGFTAEYESGTLIPDKNEIEELKWFSRDEIQEWPYKFSISWTLIKNFIQNK